MSTRSVSSTSSISSIFSECSSNASSDSPLDLSAFVGKQPFSTLVELSQRSLITAPTYIDLGEFKEKQWLAKVVVTWSGQEVEGRAFAAGKKGAKSAAARQVLDQLSGKEPIACYVVEPQFVPLAHDVLHYNRLRTLATTATIGNLTTTVLALDLEVYEHDHGMILEIGISYCPLYDIWGSPPNIITRHFIVEDFIRFRNGLFVDDKKFAFNYGVSEFVTEAAIGKTLHSIIQDMGPDTVLIGHSLHNDVEWLRSVGVEVDATVSGIVDIALVDKVMRQAGQVRGVERMLEGEGIAAQDLHNGGNDAFYTLDLCLRFVRRLALENGERESLS